VTEKTTDKTEKSSGKTEKSDSSVPEVSKQSATTTGTRRKSQKRSNSIKESKEEQDKIKVHLNSDSTVAKRITVDANTDAVGLCQKCQRQFKIEKAEVASYAIFVLYAGGTEKKLEDTELPVQILNNLKKEKKEEAKFIYKKC